MSLKKPVFAILAGGAAFLIMQMLIKNTIIHTYFPYALSALGAMRSMTDPIMLFFWLHAFVLMIGAVVLYPILKLSGNPLQKGMRLGALMWLAYSVPSSYIVYTSMMYPIGFYLEGFVFSFASWVVAGIVIARTIEGKAEKSATKAKKKRKK